MALAASNFSKFTKQFIGNSRYLFSVLYTGPASYAAPEVLTQAICRSALEGIGQVDFMIPSPAFNGSGGSVEVQFEPTNTGGNVGNIRFMNATQSHLHNLLVKGGLTIADAAGTSAAGAAFGKASASDETVVSSASAGGVVAAAAAAASTEVASTTNLSTYTCWFVGQGVE